MPFSDQFDVTELTPDYEIRIGGRRDRGDAADIEPMCHIPISAFRALESVSS
jgi:hypothetical protein